MGIGVRDVVVIAISFILVAIIGPIGINQIYNAVTTNVTGSHITWPAAVVTIFQVLLPILWVVGVAVTYIPKMRGD